MKKTQKSVLSQFDNFLITNEKLNYENSGVLTWCGLLLLRGLLGFVGLAFDLVHQHQEATSDGCGLLVFVLLHRDSCMAQTARHAGFIESKCILKQYLCQAMVSCGVSTHVWCIMQTIG